MPPRSPASAVHAAAPAAAIPYATCPAKTFIAADGRVCLGRDVFSHCQIVGEVARALLASLPPGLRRLFPDGAVLVAACHDIGKVSPTFYLKLIKASDAAWPAWAGDYADIKESVWGGHAGVSQAAAAAIGVAPLLAEALGMHHGFRPPLGARRADSENFGGAAWQAERVALVAALRVALDEGWPQAVSLAQARLLAGLTSVADWIGSGPQFEDPQQDWRPLIRQALDDAGFVPPRIRPGLSFREVFGFAPRALQQTLIAAIDGPGVYVLEAPMGQGKTEAALYCAYRLLAQGRASGIYFALPTQLTSNKLYARFNPFLEAILHPDCRHSRGLLLHGAAWLMQAEMGEEGRPGGAWFHHAKRGLLAPFAVGTVDQALMAAMNVKHGFVRAFGLAGKVVILDEVHSYDVYTGTIVEALVGLLRESGCTVIILSATLAQARRAELLGSPLSRQDYPLVSALPAGSDVACELPAPPPAARSVALRLQQEMAPALVEALSRANQGQQVLWVENTVAEAQSVYQLLVARAGGQLDCGLLHSRFTLADRQRNEGRWVALYGKQGWPQRVERGRILVGTQVLEQSLDIDADFLISRFAPTDMLLQRLGRLWRHEGTPRPSQARCEAWLLAPELDTAVARPEAAFGASAYVYSPYVLCRSLEVWQALHTLTLPDDIRSLIEASYAAREEEGDMARWLHELEHGVQRGPSKRPGRQALQRLAYGTLASAGQVAPDVAVQTRYSEADTQEVLLLRGIRAVPGQPLTELTLLDGSRIALPQRRHLLSPSGWRELSCRLQRELVGLRRGSAPPACRRERLEALGLQHVFHLGQHEYEDALLRVALVDELDRITTLDGQPLPGEYRYRYRDDLGYQRVAHED